MNIFGMKIDVLDHGFVRLVDFMGNDLSIVRAARASHTTQNGALGRTKDQTSG
jgi:thymidylate synthase ThyX